MKVTNVLKKKNKVIVSFDHDEDLIFPYDLFLEHTLIEDDTVSQKEREIFSDKIQFYLIKQSSFRYLSGRNHSKYELKLKLLKKKFNKELIAVVLSDLERLNYLDDKIFANFYFNTRLKKKKGLGLIKAELSKKGVSRQIIDDIAFEFLDDPIQEESSLYLSEKKLKVLRRKNFSNIQLKQKIFQFLSYKGFSTDIIKTTIDKLKIE